MKFSRFSVQHEPAAVFEFWSRRPDNLLRVDNAGSAGVVIRAAKDNFTPVQRRTFVRYLKVEGFVPEDAPLMAGNCQAQQTRVSGRVIWVLDPSWPYREAGFNRYRLRLFVHLTAGPVFALLLFLWLMISK